MNKTEKQAIVSALAVRLRRAKSVYVTDFTGLSVARISDLRRRLGKAGVEYLVVKNTLARRALAEAAVSGLEEHIKRPTALALAGLDAAAAAKVLQDFARESQALAVRGGLVEGRAVTPEQIKRLAQLPPREQLLAELGAAMQGPLASFAGALTVLLAGFAGALEALKAQREGAA
jgi:large subunit ribosomal protein L10